MSRHKLTREDQRKGGLARAYQYASGQRKRLHPKALKRQESIQIPGGPGAWPVYKSSLPREEPRHTPVERKPRFDFLASAFPPPEFEPYLPAGERGRNWTQQRKIALDEQWVKDGGTLHTPRRFDYIT
jgi:hypothetical protein